MRAKRAMRANGLSMRFFGFFNGCAKRAEGCRRVYTIIK